MAIKSFTGKYRFLSNFYPAVVLLDGKEYPTVEHAYQAAKYPKESEHRKIISTLISPGIAKSYGKKVILPDLWNILKYTIMRDLVYQKFEHPHLNDWLLATGDEDLIEGNTWGDTFWGVCDGVGQNNLGKLLMEIRSYYRSKNG